MNWAPVPCNNKQLSRFLFVSNVDIPSEKNSSMFEVLFVVLQFLIEQDFLVNKKYFPRSRVNFGYK